MIEEDVDDVIEELDEPAAAVALELGADDGHDGGMGEGADAGAGTGTGTLGREEDGEGDEREDAWLTSTLRSTAATQQVRREAARTSTNKKRRAAVIAEDDDDDDSDDAVFKGFSRRTRKRGRIG